MRLGFAVPALLIAAAPALAQEAPPSPEPTPALTQEAPPEPAPAGQVLHLSLDEAVERALKNNADIAVERYNPEASAETVREQLGAYDPFLFSTLSQSGRTSPGSNAFSGGDSVETDSTVYNFGASQLLPTGGELRLDFNNSRLETSNVFSSFNPSYNSTFNLGLSQPLLRGLGMDNTRFQIRTAKKNREISDVQFRQTVVNTVANVKELYYDLIYAIDNLEAQRDSLGLAQKLLDENQIKVRVGTLAPLDVVAAESEVATREEAVIVAEAALRDAEDALRRAIFPDNDPATWTTPIVPSERPSAELVTVDAQKAVLNALANRTDVVAARKGLENADLTIKFAHSQSLPGVDLVAAYGTSGIGGTFIEREGLGGPIIRTVPGGFGDALGDIFGQDYPTWTIGLNLSYPIFNRQSDAAEARARIGRDQVAASLRRLEMQITAEVRSAARAVETNYKRVATTRAARVLQERRLDAEQKKFAAGLSTNFLVTQAQRDLALAEVAELRATADYRKSVVNFDRVQEAGGGVSLASVRTTVGTSRGTSLLQSSTAPSQ
jgi:outer membrane protein TolC